jgi:hypothetical protein
VPLVPERLERREGLEDVLPYCFLGRKRFKVNENEVNNPIFNKNVIQFYKIY